MMKQGTSSDYAVRQDFDWRELFVSIPANIMVLDIHGTIVAVSRSCCSEIGCQPEDLLGGSVVSLMPERYREKFQMDLAKVLGPSPSEYLERGFRIRTLRPNGEELSARIRISLCLFGSETLLIARFSDITEEEAKEKALRYSENLLRTLFELAPLGISLKDLQTGKFLLVNPALEKATGYSKEELLGLRFWEMTPKDHWEEEWELFSRVEQEGSIGPYEKEYFHKDGHRFPVLLNSRLIEDLSGHKLVWSIIVDISERVQLEKERTELAQRLEEARRFESLALMAGSMSHQFNNLLTTVLASLEFAVEELPPDSVVLDLFQQATQAAWRASGLINKMLVYSGKNMGSYKDLDLSKLVESTLNEFLEDRGPSVRLSLELAPDPPPIKGDPDQLKQLLLQLLQNSVEAATGDVVHLEVSTAVLEVREDEAEDWLNGESLAPGPHLLLEVSDDGSGMATKLQRRAFDPFFSTKAPGRGLGLSTVLGIMRAHNGAVRLVDAEPQGLKVRMVFPLANEPV